MTASRLFFFYYIFLCYYVLSLFFFFSSRRRHTRFDCDWCSDVCSSDLHDSRRGHRRLHHGVHSPPDVRLSLWRLADRGGARAPRDQLSSANGAEEGRCRANGKDPHRSEERRVGKEGRSRWSPYH